MRNRGKNMRKWFIVLIALVNIVSAMTGSAIPAPGNPFLPPAPLPETEIPAGAYRIVSFNVKNAGEGVNRWENRTVLAAETLEELMPDCFGLQEAHLSWIATMLYQLPQYGYTGVSRRDQENFATDEHCPVFYRKDKFRLLGSDTFWLSETPGTPSKSWDSSMNRICTWAKLEDKSTGFIFVLMNTHFDHLGAQARLNSALLMNEKAREFGCPVVVTGDFNCRESQAPYLTLTAGPLRDVKYAAPDTMAGGTFNGFAGDGEYYPGSPIDFIFINAGFDALSYRIVYGLRQGRFASDHFAVWTDIVPAAA